MDLRLLSAVMAAKTEQIHTDFREELRKTVIVFSGVRNNSYTMQCICMYQLHEYYNSVITHAACCLVCVAFLTPFFAPPPIITNPFTISPSSGRNCLLSISPDYT